MVELRPEIIISRLNSFAKYLDANAGIFGNSNSLLLLNGKQKPVDTLTAALYMHFLEYEFPDTAILIGKGIVHILSSASKLKHLDETVSKANSAGGVRFNPIHRNKKSGDADTIAQLVQLARDCGGACAVVEESENLLGSFAPVVLSAFRAAGNPSEGQTPLVLKSADDGVMDLLARKDVHAQDFLLRAAYLSTRMYRKVLLDAVETVLDEGGQATHEHLSTQCRYVLDDDEKFGKLKLTKLDPSHCSINADALVQSGGIYSPKIWSSKPDSRTLSPDIIIASLGCSYRSYNSLVGRTLLINPTKAVSKAYTALLEAHGIMLDHLKDGAKVCDAVQACEAHLRANLPQGSNLPESFGHGTGLVQREAPFVLDTKNYARVRAGYVISVITAANDIPNTDAPTAPPGAYIRKLARYSLCLSDTVLVLSQGGAEPNKVLTYKAPKDLEDVSYDLNDDEESSEDDAGSDDDEAKRARVRRAAGNSGRDQEGRSIRLAAKAKDSGDSETAAQRAAHQSELMSRKIEEMQAKILSGDGAGGSNTAKVAVKPIVAYSEPAKLPRTERPTKISVDKDREVVLLPMMGQLLPVHIATIRSVAKSEEDGLHMLRFNFYTPQAAAGKECLPSMVRSLQEHALSPFIRSLSFTSRDGRNMNLQFRLIKDMQKRARQAAQLEKEEAAVKDYPRLVIDRTQKIPRLQRVQMWPNVSGRKTVGNIEAHSNGLRFRSIKGDTVDIIYANIRHAVFQPCKNEHIVLMHFHLKDPIMVGKKSRKDIQFFTELIESSTLLDNKRRALGDADEIEEERREREMRKKMNGVFRSFVSRVQKAAERAPHSTLLEFELPNQSEELQFKGAPVREMVTISTTTSALISLAEKPPFVLSLDDVEHVHFETGGMGSSRSFDLVFILKAGRAEKGKDEFVSISAIPMGKMEMIQEWLDTVVEQTYTVGRPLNWKSIVSGFVRSPRFYFDTEDDGVTPKYCGWEFLMDKTSLDEEEEGDGEDEESEFGEDSEDLESEGDDDDFDSAVEDGESDEESEDEDGDEDDGDDWEELDRQAARADRKREALEDDVEAGGKRSRPSNGKSSGKSKRSRH